MTIACYKLVSCMCLGIMSSIILCHIRCMGLLEEVRIYNKTDFNNKYYFCWLTHTYMRCIYTHRFILTRCSAGVSIIFASTLNVYTL